MAEWANRQNPGRRLNYVRRPKAVLRKLILTYQRLAPVRLRQTCRFEPSCSHYMLIAIERYGVYKGVAKGVRRLCRCHPPNGGIDYP